MNECSRNDVIANIIISKNGFLNTVKPVVTYNDSGLEQNKDLVGKEETKLA